MQEKNKLRYYCRLHATTKLKNHAVGWSHKFRQQNVR